MPGRFAIKSFLLSLQFLTVIKVAPGLHADRGEFSSSLAFFPLVGLILGSLAAGFDWAARGLWPPSLCGVLDVAWLAFLTGGLHLCGLAHAFDAVGSGADRQRALEIMQGSSGASGGLAIVVVLMVKSAAVIELSRHAAWQWFMLVPCLSRLGINVLGSFSRYAGNDAAPGAGFAGRVFLRYLPMAAASAAAAAWILGHLSGMVVLVLSVLWCLPVALWCRHRFGGISGDILGAHVETVETFMFLAAAALVRNGI